MLPENFTDEVASIYDAAETGRTGCLIPQLDDAPSAEGDTEDDE